MESKSNLVNGTRQEDVLTDNGAVTNSTSLNNVVDLFFIAGASRNMSEDSIEKMLMKSWTEDALLTLKLIFWAGDIREGAGERRFFRIALSWLEKTNEKTLIKNLKQVPTFNRWDSLFHLKTDNIFYLIHEGLKAKDALLAKWLPRKNQYNNFAQKYQKYSGLTPKQYRKLIVKLSNTVEQLMCAKEWKKVDYSHVPSVAFSKYRTAFYRNDKERIEKFLEKVEKGEEKINASAIFPHDIYRSFFRNRSQNPKSLDLQWKALPDYLKDTNERFLPICDVSGSMEGLPIAISVSLGIYLSERNKSIFQDAFITFSGNPVMEYLQGSLTEKISQLEASHWDMNTDLNKAFELVLSKAKKNNLSQSEMPTTLIVISDMEFDSCADLTNYDNLVQKYTDSGYKLPRVLFWNVNGREGNVPVCAKKKGVGLVSGASPSVIKGVLSGKQFTPEILIKEVLTNKRYETIVL